ncbi:MAG: hypothetical protein A2096_11875 [Spirochaetes bacterium GWF1_41_5]|nr:MAG: hypothetical protein A2096_11875 [Spirochaetes bacterium GWF1_41_5]HBE04473.1 endolytic transglycosylase MltG [Spirochaetia bacterium]
MIIRKFLYFISFIFFLVFTGLAGYILYNVVPGGKNEILFSISQGESLSSIGSRLESEGLIRSAAFFKYLCRLLLLEKRLKAGEFYLLDPSSGIMNIIYTLVKGRVDTVSITIEEGADTYDIDARLYKMGIINKPGIFTEYTRSRAICLDAQKRFNLKKNIVSVEGLLFPDTYVLRRGDTMQKLTGLMLDNFSRKIAVYFSNSTKLGNLYEYAIKASIIEKETAIAEERFWVSSIIHNRLAVNMKLRNDPTVIYALKMQGIWDGNIRKSHLFNYYPFSTYSIQGLPPSPICSFGIDSFLAAVFPEITDYMFFVAVSGGSGHHVFTRNYQDHEQNVNRYQR